MAVLNIYKASAGSGKTFRLAVEYLKIVLQDPKTYRNVLAVTFTNKATGEMKDRILMELYHLSKGHQSNYIDILKDETGLAPDIIRRRATEVIGYLLHDYSRFSVSTIDSFFQRIIRGFGREIGIHSGFNVELNENARLEEAIDRLFFNMDKNESLSKWLLDYAESKLREGKNWNFRNEVGRFASNVLKEEFKAFDEQLIEKIANKDFMTDYQKELRAIRLDFEKQFKDIGKQVKEIYENSGLTISDFAYGKTGVGGYLLKLADGPSEPKGRALAALDNMDKWTTGKATSDQKIRVETAFTDGLNDCLRKAVDLWDEGLVDYTTAGEILVNLYQLGMLTDLSKELKALCREKNLMLLSDSGELLMRIIGNDDAPFIYEKIGNQYQNYMIDEFQDTSVVQWRNFRPLLENALSEDESCLIVGDVKQSIYRWRNGDWTLLSHQAAADFQNFGVNDVNMDTNWRSAANVIRFVNSVFDVSPKVLQQSISNELKSSILDTEDDANMSQFITGAYLEHYQHVKKPSEGGVAVDFIEGKNLGEWREAALDRMVEKIEELQDAGVAVGDMAILVRKASEGQMVADKLLGLKASREDSKYRYDVISNDSLYLSNSSAVRFVLSFLKYLADSNDKINQTVMVSEYIKYLLPRLQENNLIPTHFIADDSGQLGLFDAPVVEEHSWNEVFDDHDALLQRYFPYLNDEHDLWLANIKQFSIYEMVQQIVRWYGLTRIEDELPYIQTFLDVLVGFSSKENSDIISFLDWWEKSGKSSTVRAEDASDAITVLTIHKSKGLEFPVVFIPFCNWDLQPKSGSVIWCKPDTAPFNELDLIPIGYSARLANSIFANNYYYEKVQSYIDNLNLLYVAFTRAGSYLHVICQDENSKSRKASGDPKNVSQLLKVTFDSQEVFKGDSLDFETMNLRDHFKEAGAFEVGEIIPSKPKEEVDDEDQAIQMQELNMFDYSEKLSLRLHNEDYFVLDENETFAKINHGNIIHEIFAHVVRFDDIERSIKRVIAEGKISRDEKDEYIERIESVISNSDTADWFDGSWEVYPERPILLGQGQTRRPDRVMIKDEEVIIVDFKTGEKHDPSYQRQLKEYMRYFKQMGYTSVKGYLWFTLENEVAEITN